MPVIGISSCAFSFFLIRWAVAVPRFETERNPMHVPYKLTGTAVDAGRGFSMTAGYAARLQASGEQAAMRGRGAAGRPLPRLRVPLPFDAAADKAPRTPPTEPRKGENAVEFSLENWTAGYAARLHEIFPGRVLFIGLQGSRARGEAGPDSDIDMVVVLDRVELADLEAYRRMIATLPDTEKCCGFFCGRKELAGWPPFDALALALDTRPLYGELEGLLPPCRAETVREALRVSAANLYHALCHGWLYEGDPAHVLDARLKEAFFAVRLAQLAKTGVYTGAARDLAQRLPPDSREAAILRLYQRRGCLESAEIPGTFRLLLEWSSAALTS